MVSIVWFRNDLRLHDNPALTAAIRSEAPVLALYVLEDAALGDPTPGGAEIGGACRWWLHHSLSALLEALGTLGIPLVLRRGSGAEIVPRLAHEVGATAIYWNRDYDPHSTRRDTQVEAGLRDAGIHVESFNGRLIREPWEVKKKDGGWYGVFTPFWKAEVTLGDPDAPLPAPDGPKECFDGTVDSDGLVDWGLLPRNPDWAKKFEGVWQPGEAGALERLRAFIADGLPDYADGRNRPDVAAVSRLSPHFRFGELSPRMVWHSILHAASDGRTNVAEEQAWAFLREVGWRDFNHNLLFHNPSMVTANYDRRFDDFPWAANEDGLRAWRQGMTGFPMVDAGMRELWQTGYMHNRVRMIAASFLVKDLLIPWQEGEAWFRDTLVDADIANNVANWQWVAGSGADAAPYFRIFNPVTQGRKFDPKGDYVRRFVPELAGMPNEYIHEPWAAPEEVLAGAGVRLGADYPHPIVDHGKARKRALDAYERIKGAA